MLTVRVRGLLSTVGVVASLAGLVSVGLALAVPAGAVGSWTVQPNIAGTPQVGWRSVSCVKGGSLCVAGGYDGNAGVAAFATTTNPVGGSWSLAEASRVFPTPPPPAFTDRGIIYGVSCSSATACVAVSSSGAVITSSNPTSGAGAWSDRPGLIANLPEGISCPSTTLCVVADAGGNVDVSTNPASGAWTVTNLTSSAALLGISCASVSLCVATDGSGDVFTSTNPTGGAGAWSGGLADTHGAIHAVACLSTTVCSAADTGGFTVFSTNPKGGSSTWTTGQVFAAAGAETLSCPATNLCALGASFGHVETFNATETEGTGAVVSNGSANVLGMSCPSVSLCVGVDDGGNAIVGTNLADELPKASFTFSPTTPTTGVLVTFNASASSDPDGTIVTYKWQFGDGSKGTGVQPTHKYANAGTFTIKLTVTDSNGLAKTTKHTITIS